MDINRGNKKLLERLVEISKGKHVSLILSFYHIFLQLSVEPLASTSNVQSQTLSQLVSFRPKSLNLVVRKREIQNIEQENFKFAKRLFESHGDISVKDHKMGFKEHQKLVQNMQKLKKTQGQKAMKASRHGLLPPLGATTVTASKKQLQGSPRGEIEEEAKTEQPEKTPNLSTTQVASQEQQQPQKEDQHQKIATTKDSATTQDAIVSERIVNESNNNN